MGILHSKSRFFGCKTEEEEAAYNLQQNDSVGLPRRLWSLIYKSFGWLLGLVWRRKKGKPPLLPVQNTEAAEPLLVKLQRERDGDVVLPIPGLPSYKKLIPSSTLSVRKDAPTNAAPALEILHSKSRFFGCKTEEEEAAAYNLQQNQSIGLLVEENSNDWRGSESVDDVLEEIKLRRERDGSNVVLPIPSYKEVMPSSTVSVPTYAAPALEKEKKQRADPQEKKKSSSSASAVSVTRKDAPTSNVVVSMKITSSSQVQTDDERYCKSSVDVLSNQQRRLKNNQIFTCPSATSSTNVLRKDAAAEGIIEGMHKKKKKAYPEQEKEGLMSCCKWETPLSTVSVRKDGPINALVLEEMTRIKKADVEEEKKKVKLSSRFIHENKSGMKKKKKKVEQDHHVVVSKERWIKHYSSSHRILLVGEGDFSFSASLALAFSPAASNIIATSLNPQAFLINNYSRAASNIEVLKTRHSKVIHEVDATKMATHPSLQHLQLDRIIFNFPYAGLAHLKNLPREPQLRSHRRLVSKFLMNAKEMISEDGEIHISHKTNAFHAEFMLESIACSHKLRLIEAVDFNHLDYPGYNTKCGFGGDNNFYCYPSKTYKFAIPKMVLMASSSSSSKSQANELCKHGFPAVRRTSWSDDNPGRRFLNCKFSQTFKDCGYFSWFDEPMCARATQIIPGLLRNKNKVERELKSAEEDNKALLLCIQKLEDEVKHLKAKLKKRNKGKENLMNVHLYYILLLTLSWLPVFVKWAVNKMF